MKNVILFLVEGITDKVALEEVVDKTFGSETTAIEVTYGDITTKKGVNVQNVVDEVGNFITNFIKNGKYEKQDILKIVHIIDTDGAFIPRENIKKSNDCHLKYGLEYIECENEDYIKNRNAQKIALVKKLASRERIARIRYELYYFSRNMEHVFHNVSEELDKNQKMELAEKFTDTYCDNIEGFFELINSPNIAVSGEYKETWDFIYLGTNSLKRYSNVHLAFK